MQISDEDYKKLVSFTFNFIEIAIRHVPYKLIDDLYENRRSLDALCARIEAENEEKKL